MNGAHDKYAGSGGEIKGKESKQAGWPPLPQESMAPEESSCTGQNLSAGGEWGLRRNQSPHSVGQVAQPCPRKA